MDEYLESHLNLSQVTQERDSLPHRPPLLVKVAPDLSEKDKEDIVAVMMREKVRLHGKLHQTFAWS